MELWSIALRQFDRISYSLNKSHISKKKAAQGQADTKSEDNTSAALLMFKDQICKLCRSLKNFASCQQRDCKLALEGMLVLFRCKGQMYGCWYCSVPSLQNFFGTLYFLFIECLPALYDAACMPDAMEAFFF